MSIARNRPCDTDCFWEALFQDVLKDQQHFVELRQLDRTKAGRNRQDFCVTIGALAEELKKPQLAGVDRYFGVQARNKQRGTNTDVDVVTCVYADVDFKNFQSPRDAAALIKRHKFSIIVETGHGYHVYALLKVPISLDRDPAQYIERLRAFQQALRSDPVHDLARILRVPGSMNYKGDQPAECKIVWADYSRRYDLSEFPNLAPAKSTRVEVNPSAGGKIHEGQGRNVHLTSLAGSMRHRGMREAAILAALREENKVRCSPELPENEVRTIAHSVSRYEPGNKTVAQLLTDAGFDALGNNPTTDSVGTVLERLRNVAGSVDRLKKALIREEASKFLEAKGMKSPKHLVDAALQAVGQDTAASNGQGKAFLFEDPEPWPEPVDGAQLLFDVEALFKKFVVLPEGGASILALWTLYSYVFDAFDVAPYITLTSPEKRCGKTRTLEVLHAVARRPFFLANLTTATAFRMVEAYRPTLLVDEADRFLAKNEELKGILNSGYRRGAVVPRCVGDDHELKAFDPFCPKAIASIGDLADTLEDRSIVFQMRRRAEGESIAKFRQEEVRAQCSQLRQKAARWAADDLESLRVSDPTVPEGLNDREEDNWRPLLAVAEQAGTGWAARARELALAFSSSVSREDSAGIMLLTDLRTLFEGHKTDRLSSDGIVKALGQMEERPWPEWKRGKSISTQQLARLLGRFGIKPKQLWVSSGKVRGYEVADFKDAFSRYLPASPVGPVGAVGSNGDADLKPFGNPVGIFGHPVESDWGPVISSPDGDGSPASPAPDGSPTGAKRKPTGGPKTSGANSRNGSTGPTGPTWEAPEPELTFKEILNQAMARAKADLEAWSSRSEPN